MGAVRAGRGGGAQRPARSWPPRRRERLSEIAAASGTDWALGAAARSRALLADGRAADELYREAIERLGRTRMAAHLARARLCYGEWLRRENRRVDAREPAAARVRGVRVHGRSGFRRTGPARARWPPARRCASASGDTRADLTPQEAEIAQLARDGLTNPEIGAQLFIEPRTVEWHLRKVFAKLDIGSRRELDGALRRQEGEEGVNPARSESMS